MDAKLGLLTNRPMRYARFVLLGIIACGALIQVFGMPVGYSGDGRLVDNGPLAATDRYVLDLGEIDLESKSKRTYSLVNLPTTSFVVGLEIVPTTQSARMTEGLINPTLSMSMKDGSGKEVFAVASPLRLWTWSIPSTGAKAFIYHRDHPGSFVYPRSETTYALTVEVITPDKMPSPVHAKVLLKSSGLK